MDELDSWFSLVKALPAAGIVLYVAKCLGASLAGQSTSVHLHVVLGVNLVGLLALLMGFLPHPIPFLCLCFLGIAFLARDTKEFLDAKRKSPQQSKLPSSLPTGLTSHVIQTTLVVSVGITLGPALTFPSGWDELTYHISLPQRWTHAESISVQKDLPYSALPSLCELLFWIVHPLEALVTPRLLTWVIWLEGFFLLNEVVARFSNTANRIAILWTLAASPAFLMVSANCYVESFIWANTAALCYQLLIVDADSKSFTRLSIISGLLIGGSIATKMTSVGLIVLPVLAWMFSKPFDSRNARKVAICLLASGLFAIAFYVRPWIQFGNPLGPYYAAWFTSDPAIVESSRYHHDLAVGNFGLGGFVGLAAGPIAIAFANELYDGNFGWQWFIVLGLAVVGAMRWRAKTSADRGPLRVLVFTSLFLYVLWFATAQQARFAIPIFVMAALAAAIGLEKLDLKWQKFGRAFLVLAALYSLPWIHVGYYLDSWLCVLKIRTPVDYIRDGVGDSYAELSTYLSLNAKPTEKYLTLFEHRLTYLPDNVEIATPYFQWKYFRDPTRNSAEQIVEELKEHQVTHVIFAHSPVGPDLSVHRFELQQNWFKGVDESIAKGYLRVIWKSDLHAVAELAR